MKAALDCLLSLFLVCCAGACTDATATDVQPKPPKPFVKADVRALLIDLESDWVQSNWCGTPLFGLIHRINEYGDPAWDLAEREMRDPEYARRLRRLVQGARE